MVNTRNTARDIHGLLNWLPKSNNTFMNNYIIWETGDGNSVPVCIADR